MSRTHVALPSLVHGVSQLPAAERQPVHAQASDNCWPTVEHGDQKRPPLIWVKRVQASSFGDCYSHGIDRGSGERYMALFKYGATTANGLVFDTTGTVVPVFKNTASYAAPTYVACDYLYLQTGSSPSQNIRALTVLDYTFVTNRAIAVTMANTTTTAAPTTVAHVFIRQGAFAMRYTVRIKTNTVDTTVVATTFDSISVLGGAGTINLTNPDSAVANDGAVVCDFTFSTTVFASSRSSVKTQDIAECLKQRLSGDVSGAANFAAFFGANTVTVGKFTVTRIGSVLKIVSNDGPITIFEVSTAQGNQLAYGIQNDIDSQANLPLTFTHNYVIKVKGNQLADEDDFWLKFTSDTAAAGLSKGTWSETNKPGITYTWVYTPSSLHPHTLVRRTSDGINPASVAAGDKFFSFEPVNLSERLVGDTTSNPNPNFVSVTGVYQPSGGGGTVVAFPVVRKVLDMAFFRDRLVFACDEGVSCSEQGSYFNFFRTTVRALPDSDPIDVSISGDQVTQYHSAVPHGGKLILFSEQLQSRFEGSPTLTPSSVEGDQVSRFQCTRACAPHAYKAGILFPTIAGSYTGLRSLYPKQSVENVYDAEDLSIHTPSYIPGTARQIEVNTDSSVIAVLTDGDTDAIYILKQHREGDQVLQSAWTRFVLDGATIRGIKFFDSKLYVVAEYTSSAAAVGVHLGYIDLSAGVSDEGRDYWLYLDRRVSNTTSGVGIGAFGGGVTVVTMPYDLETGVSIELVTTANLLRYQGTVTGLNTFSVPVNLAGLAFVAGKKYTSVHQFHKPDVQIDAQTGKRLVLDSTSAVIGLYLRYENTRYFTIVSGAFTKVIGNTGLVADPVVTPFNDQTFVGVGGRLDTQFDCSAENDSPFPHSLISAEWLLNTNIRSPALR